jgi:predicted transcriptional regulator
MHDSAVSERLGLWQHRVTWRTNVSTAKEELTRLIESQPADASREEIVRELAFHVMVERGLADADAKRVISNEDMARRIRAWQK